ncbi:MAG: Glycosyl transferase family 2 [Candidatus Methanohalarchaeum thermophilum]|uniref:Glycosyl transferase family 2 n=1 Tax=Methanohalarchaeum thermophilum TaxID=1903181 RepID=A0A1Q6DSN7_METT1|nr:MAG: Glycosyl transferase family 2 [Candidatus Methanohalarchaeum thermophilum]
MRVSVLVPTFNRKEKLEKCLDSLIFQDFDGNYEVIVIDDGSTDGTRSFLEDMGKNNEILKYFFQENKGPASARNKGIEESKGEIIFLTDDDVVMPEDWISSFLPEYNSEEIGGVGGYIEVPGKERSVFDDFNEKMSKEKYGIDNKKKVGGFESPAGGTGNMSYRKDILNDFRFDEKNFRNPGGEDADLKKRICNAGYKIVYLPVKGEHLHSLDFFDFIKNSFTRGKGIGSYTKKWNGLPKSIFLLPVAILTFLLGYFSFFFPIVFLILVFSYGFLKTKDISDTFFENLIFTSIYWCKKLSESIGVLMVYLKWN